MATRGSGTGGSKKLQENAKKAAPEVTEAPAKAPAAKKDAPASDDEEKEKRRSRRGGRGHRGRRSRRGRGGVQDAFQGGLTGYDYRSRRRGDIPCDIGGFADFTRRGLRLRRVCCELRRGISGGAGGCQIFLNERLVCRRMSEKIVPLRLCGMCLFVIHDWDPFL